MISRTRFSVGLLAALLSVVPASLAMAGTGGGEEQGTPGPDGESAEDGDESSSDDDDFN